jgi:hypothetical protein
MEAAAFRRPTPTNTVSRMSRAGVLAPAAGAGRQIAPCLPEKCSFRAIIMPPRISP